MLSLSNLKSSAATIVSSIVVIVTTGAAVYNLPDPWAVDLLKLLVGGAVAWLLLDRQAQQVEQVKEAQVRAQAMIDRIKE